MKWYNWLGVAIFSISFFDRISYAFGWKLTFLAPWLDVVCMIVGVYLAFYKPKEKKIKPKL